MFMKIFIPETEREAAIEWKMQQLLQQVDDARLQVDLVKREYAAATQEWGMTKGIEGISREYVNINKLLGMSLRDFASYVENRVHQHYDM